jgi:hypothetical protein
MAEQRDKNQKSPRIIKSLRFFHYLAKSNCETIVHRWRTIQNKFMKLEYL